MDFKNRIEGEVYFVTDTLRMGGKVKVPHANIVFLSFGLAGKDCRR
ncbi:MAG: hypothetical protein PHT07_01820 [Paludibacter sp.]|nr:hypothetical protein [Paludibacter sp.]